MGQEVQEGHLGADSSRAGQVGGGTSADSTDIINLAKRIAVFNAEQGERATKKHEEIEKKYGVKIDIGQPDEGFDVSTESCTLTCSWPPVWETDIDVIIIEPPKLDVHNCKLAARAYWRSTKMYWDELDKFIAGLGYHSELDDDEHSVVVSKDMKPVLLFYAWNDEWECYTDAASGKELSEVAAMTVCKCTEGEVTGHLNNGELEVQKCAHGKTFTIPTHLPCWSDFSRGRNELYCIHNIGHGPRSHGCDGCCSDKDFKEEFVKCGGRWSE